MSVQNLDLQFEDYIIFHRGVQEVVFKDNNLHVIYQDGYDQDLGDPLGDRVAKAESIKEYAETLEATLEDLENKLTSQLSQSEQYNNSAAVQWAAVEEAYNYTKDYYENIKDKLNRIYDNVNGLRKDEETDEYYVDLSNYSSTEATNELINNSIAAIEGMASYEDSEGNTVYYLNPMEDNSKTNEAVDNMISTQIKSISGVVYNETTSSYEIQLGDTSITSDQIETLFA